MEPDLSGMAGEQLCADFYLVLIGPILIKHLPISKGLGFIASTLVHIRKILLVKYYLDAYF